MNKVKLSDCINFVKEARAKGLTIPVVLMGESSSSGDRSP